MDHTPASEDASKDTSMGTPVGKDTPMETLPNGKFAVDVTEIRRGQDKAMERGERESAADLYVEAPPEASLELDQLERGQDKTVEKVQRERGQDKTVEKAQLERGQDKTVEKTQLERGQDKTVEMTSETEKDGQDEAGRKGYIGLVDGKLDNGEERGLLEYAESLDANEKPTTTDGTFTLIGKSLFFSDRNGGNLRLCVPNELIDEVLHSAHDVCGHPGIRRTFLAVSLRYYFPRMSQRIKAYVDNCSTCQLSKPSHELQAGLLHPVKTPDPFHTLSLDFVTGMPTSRSYDALLTVTDKFSKAIKLIPCKKSTTAEETAELFLRDCYTTFGLPVKLISDRDARFTSKFWSTLMSLLNVRVGMTAAFHPSADGQAERTNQTVEIALRCFLGGDLAKYPKWVDYLPIVEHEYNSFPHASTGMTPNELRFAMQPRGLVDLMHPFEGTSETAETLAEDLKNRRDEARDSIAIAQRKQKRYADARRTPKEFEVGELVVLKLNRFGAGYKPLAGHAHKLGPFGTPVRIVEKLSPLSYRIDLPAGSRIHDVVSLVHLRKYRGTGADVRPLPTMVEEEPEWEVESVDGERKSRGRKEYLIRWKGYGIHERTWEPLDHLEHAGEEIAEWNSRQPEVNPEEIPRPRRSRRSTRIRA
jgi:hypothetical protein